MRARLNVEERKERRRRVVARSKFALPSTITLISVLCGFSSVVMSINAAGDHPSHYFTWSAALLVLAGVFDGLDGRVARATPPLPVGLKRPQPFPVHRRPAAAGAANGRSPRCGPQTPPSSCRR